MISFSKLGNYGRLGNQLFQYAFLRTTAIRLGTQFYCPNWEGDKIFRLNDGEERVTTQSGIKFFFDSGSNAGYTAAAREIDDNTEIQGFFQSEKYYDDANLVRKWFSFNYNIIEKVTRLYGEILKENPSSFSLRLDSDYGNTREYFPLYPLSYYKNSISFIKQRGPILVFADRTDLARKFLHNLTGQELIFVENLSGPEQLYLMSQCKVNVITNSTFSWWGAWLNSFPGNVVIAPSHWCRAGVPYPIEGILCDSWIKVDGTHPIFDHFQAWRIRHPGATLKRALNRVQAKTRKFS